MVPNYSVLENKIVITIGYTYDKTKWFRNCQGIPHFRTYLIPGMIQFTSKQHLQRLLIGNDIVKNVLFCKIRYTYDKMKSLKCIPRDYPF